MNNFLNLKPKNLAFLLHDYCNLRCSYCWERYENKSWKQKMDFDKFKIIIDYFAENYWITSNDKERPWIKLGGGEIFFFPKEIMKMIDYILELKNIITPPQIILQTNGTCIPSEFFEKYSEKDLSLGLSLDGPKDLHDEQRDNSYDKIPIEKILNNFPNTKVYLTMNKKNIYRIPEAWKYIDDLGFKRKQLTINRYDDCSNEFSYLNSLTQQINCSVNFKENKTIDIDLYELKDTLETIVINPYGNYWICNHPPVSMPDGWGSCGNYLEGIDINNYNKIINNFLKEKNIQL